MAKREKSEKSADSGKSGQTSKTVNKPARATKDQKTSKASKSKKSSKASTTKKASKASTTKKPSNSSVVNKATKQKNADNLKDRSFATGSRPKADGDLIPVVAIGASAGGLEPIEQFFDSMSVNSGCAFVIIQHLSPDFRSLMDELLARHSSMNIHRVTDGIQLAPNSIYLNPARSVMTLFGNKLVVNNLSSQDTVYLPIDLFFESLANERGESAIGLVLSGTGSDGTKGCKAISQANGTVLVQDPATTRFDGMPRSVITDNNYTLIGSPDTLATSVEKLLNKESIDGLLDASERLPIEDPLSDLLSMLKHRYGTDFLQYKEATVHRRIERRAQMRGITDIDDYRDILNTDEPELQDLYDDLLIEVTEFFRDPDAFDILRTKVIPDLTADLKDGGALRVWVPGCASGEEAYSIAILLQEQARAQGIYLHLKILATDIHIRSMNQASSGIYPESALDSMPRELVDRYFDCADGQAQIKPSIRNMVFFSTHDVMRDPPFTRIDLIGCRNLLIYLKEPAQEKVLNLLHFSLRKGGVLFLGPSEHIGAISHEFDTINEKWRIFRKRRDVKLLPPQSIFARADLARQMPQSANQMIRTHGTRTKQHAIDDTVPFKRAQKAALESIVAEYAPPGFLLTDNGSVVHIFGDAGKLLPMQSGSFSKNITDLIKPQLKVIVTTAIDNGRSAGFSGFRRSAYIREEDGTATTFEVSLKNLELPGEATRFQLLSINEIVPSATDSVTPKQAKPVEELEVYESNTALNQRILVLEHSLQSSEESLQSTIEELETSNEELQSTNEELMSTNEELQSTNEELHSVNEELYTVSAEHQRKNEELTERDTDIDVLLQSSKIGTIHLDDELRLRRYTNKARSVFNIMPQDVGRPITHITIKSSEHDILRLIDEVNDTQQTHETRITVESESYLLRIMPYKTQEQISKGVLITVIDVTDLQNMRFTVDELNIRYKDIIENTNSFISRWDAHTSIITYCNQPYAERWESTVEKIIGSKISEVRSASSHKLSKEFIAGIKPGGVKTGVYTDYAPNGEKRTAIMTVRALSSDNKTTDEYQATGFDITEEQNYTDSLNSLYAIFSDESLDNNNKLEQILAVGLDYFKLDTALISMIVGQKYTIKTIQSYAAISYEVNDVLNLDETICGQMTDSQTVFAIDDLIGNGMGELNCSKKTGIESFLGAQIQTNSGPYGTVSFSSQKPRGVEFTARDNSLALIIAGWVGFIIGNNEQLEFVSSQNEYYQSLFKTIPTMMFLSDRDGLIISASNRLCENLGITPESVPGNNCTKYFSENDKNGIIKVLKDGDAFRQPFTLVGSGGEPTEIEMNSSVQPIGTMQKTRMVILNDVSARNAASRKAEEQNHKLELANESLNQFAFIASHDLQEPLRKIQQFSSFLEDDLGEALDTDAKYHLSVIIDASQRMSTLIHDLLQYSGASKEIPVMEPISLKAIVADVLGELQLPVEESGAVITTESLPNVNGNRALLTQLFTNLIGNSIKYRSPDRVPNITVSGMGQDGKEGVVIADNGIGIDMAYAKKIFEPFNRLHNSKQYKGNGVGLAICVIVCSKHKWKLDVDSKVDIGSEFKITFHDHSTKN